MSPEHKQTVEKLVEASGLEFEAATVLVQLMLNVYNARAAGIISSVITMPQLVQWAKLIQKYRAAHYHADAIILRSADRSFLIGFSEADTDIVEKMINVECMGKLPKA